MVKRLRYCLLAALVIGLVLVPSWVSARVPAGSVPLAYARGDSEIRGVWITNVDSDVLFSRQGLELAVDRLAASNFNTLYPAVWSWGYTLFPSAVATREIGYKQGIYPDLEDQGRNEALEAAQGNRDLLQELVGLARTRNLSVIPWFEFSFMAPANSPLAQRHPDWLTQKRGSSPQAKLYQEGRHTRVWLSPFHPQVQQFILDLVAELMANYDVDGLQLDDHFGLPVEFGYDPYTVALYQREHGGRTPPANPQDPEWMRWRADKISRFLERVFRVVKTHRPNAVISVSPNPARFAYSRYLQDWPRWEQEGYVEELIVQVYRDSLGSFNAVLQEPEIVRARGHIPTAVGILTGLKNAPVPINLISQKVRSARDRGYAGVSFFFYDTLWNAAGETPEARQAAVRSLFPSPRRRASIVSG
ncbi:MAG: glycoside hydrolase family 10 protein [Cyanobacteria bacterium Co-bin13]|nr:glycoside hydrolase family 10 protein [Cyanobacteria bacterium Co-bin13]